MTDTQSRTTLESLGYTTEVADKGEQTVHGLRVREKLLRATAADGKFVEGLVSVDTMLPVSMDSEEPIWRAMLDHVMGASHAD